MSHSFHILAVALVWGAGGAAIAWLLTWPFRRLGWIGGHISIALVATLATVAAIAGNARAMLISTADGHATVIAAVIAGLLASCAALLSARTFRRDSAFLHTDIAAISAGDVPDREVRPMSRDLRALHHAIGEMGENLAATRRREQILDASRREMVSWISHDLRTPLAGLQELAEADRSGVTGDPTGYQRRIAAEVSRLTSAVDDLQQLNGLHAGTPARRSERVDLSKLVAQTLTTLQEVAADSHVRLAGSPGEVAEVMGDADQLSRALTGLVYNAIRHSTEAGVVTVDLCARSAQGQAALRVTDSCGGVAPEDAHDLMAADGARPTDAAASHPGGGGTDLRTTREIVGAHDGAVEFENTDDGCAFTIVLPLAS